MVSLFCGVEMAPREDEMEETLVAADGWSVSYTSGSGINGIRLSACRMEPHTSKILERGEGNGQEFSTEEDARDSRRYERTFGCLQTQLGGCS